MKMADRMSHFGNLAPLDPESRKAAIIRRLQAKAPRHPSPINLMPGTAAPDCEACGGDAKVCTLDGPNWRLCPHAGPAAAGVMQQPRPWAR